MLLFPIPRPLAKVKNTFIDVADEESPDSMTSFHDGAKTCTARMSETASPARFFISHDSRADDMNYCICRNRGFFFFQVESLSSLAFEFCIVLLTSRTVLNAAVESWTTSLPRKPGMMRMRCRK